MKRLLHREVCKTYPDYTSEYTEGRNKEFRRDRYKLLHERDCQYQAGYILLSNLQI